MSMAFRTAQPGTDVGTRSLLIRTLLSMMMRGLLVIREDFGQPIFGHATRGCTLGNTVAEPLKLGRVQRTQPVIFVARQQNGHIAVLPADDDRLALRCVEYCGKPLFGIGC
jgi:hypothetical protein